MKASAGRSVRRAPSAGRPVRRARRTFCAAIVALLAGAANAQSVSLSGSFGDKALLVIDGQPRTLAVGSTVQGVRLLSVGSGEAVIESKGKRMTLQLGGAQVNLGAAPSEGGGSQIVLSAESGGHFSAGGSINGKAVRFLVDTGATNVAMSQTQADRLGLDWKSGARGASQTANGVVPAYRVSLGVVRIGDVQVYNVDATVLPGHMDFVLLGNSFLSRFQMRRDNDTLTLVKRF